MIKKILVFLLVVLIVIQFFRPKKNISTAPATFNIATVYNTPDNVKHILEVACNDCHSNNTRYPWYAEVQPVAWWLDEHVQEGKRELNFDEFISYRPRRQYVRMEQTIDLVKKKEMPLDSYTWIHKDAILSDEQKEKLFGWAQGVRKQMEQTYPKDSLVRKK
jgi:hypothetical protein